MFASPTLSGFAGGLLFAGGVWLLVRLWPSMKRWLAARKRVERPPPNPNQRSWRSILKELGDRAITWICLVLAAILIAMM